MIDEESAAAKSEFLGMKNACAEGAKRSGSIDINDDSLLAFALLSFESDAIENSNPSS
jgi:hypothetical protein